MPRVMWFPSSSKPNMNPSVCVKSTCLFHVMFCCLNIVQWPHDCWNPLNPPIFPHLFQTCCGETGHSPYFAMFFWHIRPWLSSWPASAAANCWTFATLASRRRWHRCTGGRVFDNGSWKKCDLMGTTWQTDAFFWMVSHISNETSFWMNIGDFEVNWKVRWFGKVGVWSFFVPSTVEFPFTHWSHLMLKDIIKS